MAIINLKVKVNTNSTQSKMFFKDSTLYVYFKAIREKGQANEKLIEILSDFFEIPKTSLSINSGTTHSIKTIQVHGDPEKIQHLLQSVPKK